MSEITYRKLEKCDLDGVKDIDRSESAEHTYGVKDGTLVLQDLAFEHPGFHVNHVGKIIADLKKGYDTGDVFFGAFDLTTLVGISGVEAEFVGTRHDMLNMSPLWISKPYRQRGIGRTLLAMAREEARTRHGVKKLYISATYSQHTIDFYLSQGCRLVAEPDERLYALEPDDIHLELDL